MAHRWSKPSPQRKYTKADAQKFREMWKTMPLTKVAKEVGINIDNLRRIMREENDLPESLT